jgi:hypothetical protein
VWSARDRQQERQPGVVIRRHTTAAMHIGANYWYMAPNGSTTAIIEVRDGTVREIGTATKLLTQNRKAQLTFITSFS